MHLIPASGLRSDTTLQFISDVRCIIRVWQPARKACTASGMMLYENVCTSTGSGICACCNCIFILRARPYYCAKCLNFKLGVEHRLALRFMAWKVRLALQIEHCPNPFQVQYLNRAVNTFHLTKVDCIAPSIYY